MGESTDPTRSKNRREERRERQESEPMERGERQAQQGQERERGRSARQLEPVRERRRGLGFRQDPFGSIAPHELFSASPFELMRRLSEEMNRAFEGFGFGGREGRGGSPFWTPSVELKERDGELVARIDLPGLEPDDVSLDITEDGIVVRGERKREDQEEGEGWTRSEVSYGQFMRVIPLPQGADAENASAQFEKGVLCIRVPIAEDRGRRSIPIQDGRRETGAHGSGPGSGDGGRRSDA